jgi:hypothetical protein
MVIHAIYSILMQIKSQLKYNEDITYLIDELDYIYLRYGFNDKQCCLYLNIKNDYNNSQYYDNEYYYLRINKLIEKFIEIL